MLRIALAISIAVWNMTPICADEPADKALEGFFRQYLDDYAKTHPVEACRLGDYRYADRMNDLSPKARAADREWTKNVLERLETQIDPKNLTRSAQIDYEILRHDLRFSIWLGENTKPFEEDPRSWNEYLVDSIFALLTQTTLDKPTAIRTAATRMEFIPLVVASAQASLKKPFKTHLETAIRQNRGAIAFFEKNIFELTGETPQLSVLAKPTRAAVEALRAHQKLLESLLPEAHENWRLGKEKFAKKLDLEFDAGLSADEVLKEAEAEADRVRRDMYVIARQLWHKTCPDKPLPADDEKGRRDTIRLVLAELGKDHGSPQSQIADARPWPN
jgi:hypothetical protein